jgi:hypothetical protein
LKAPTREREDTMTDRRFSKEDLERNEDPRTIAGAVSGASGAAFGGGVGMVAFGPVGALAGAMAGAVGGWWAGTEMQSAFEEMDRVDPELRSAHAQAGREREYAEVRHAYQLGWLAGRNPQYGDAPFDEIDRDLRAAWVQAHIEEQQVISWDDVRGHARTGFDVGRRHRPAGSSR